MLGALPEAWAAVAALRAEPGGAEHQLGGPRAPAGVLAGHRVLDVFAGSGALGIEALSRGAAACTFVEAAPPALRALRRNLERLAVPVVRPAAADGTAEQEAPSPRAVVQSAPMSAAPSRLTPVATHGILSCLRTRRTRAV